MSRAVLLLPTLLFACLTWVGLDNLYTNLVAATTTVRVRGTPVLTSGRSGDYTLRFVVNGKKMQADGVEKSVWEKLRSDDCYELTFSDSDFPNIPALEAKLVKSVVLVSQNLCE
jgi:hypothetical protein